MPSTPNEEKRYIREHLYNKYLAVMSVSELTVEKAKAEKAQELSWLYAPSQAEFANKAAEAEKTQKPALHSDLSPANLANEVTEKEKAQRLVLRNTMRPTEPNILTKDTYVLYHIQTPEELLLKEYLRVYLYDKYLNVLSPAELADEVAKAARTKELLV